MMKDGGKFIVFEGTDGSGKSTQMKLLSGYLKEKGEEVYLTREPSDSPFGMQVHSCLTGRIDTDEHTIAALFAADRFDHIFNNVNGILHQLERGVNVLCDRYYFSSFAYNGDFVSLDWIVKLNEPAMKALKADLTIFIDVSVEEGMRRVGRRGEKERYETQEKQTLVKQRYLELFEKMGEGENIAIVKSEKSKEETQQKIRAYADKLFGF